MVHPSRDHPVGSIHWPPPGSTCTTGRRAKAEASGAATGAHHRQVPGLTGPKDEIRFNSVCYQNERIKVRTACATAADWGQAACRPTGPLSRLQRRFRAAAIRRPAGPIQGNAQLRRCTGRQWRPITHAAASLCNDMALGARPR